MLPYVSGIAFILMVISCWLGYRNYRTNSVAWKKYVLLYLFSTAILHGIQFFLFFAGDFPLCCRESFQTVLDLIRFFITGVLLYTYPLCILSALRKQPSAKLKVLLGALAGGVLFFGIIVLMWRLSRLSAALQHFVYLHLLFFTGLGLSKQKLLWKDPLKRGLLLLLYPSGVFFLWAIINERLFKTETMYGHIIFTFVCGLIFTVVFLYALSRKRKPESTERDELFEDVGITRREREIIKLIENGMSNVEIQHYLDIDLKSVDSYIFTIYKKLDVNNRRELFKKLYGE